MTKWALVLGFVAVGCTSQKTPQEMLVGDWLFMDGAGTSGVGLKLQADGSYTFAEIVLTSTSTANAQEETGVYSATATDLTMTPLQWSCPGPDPSSTVSYSFAGADLVVRDPNGIVTLAPNNATGSETFAITLGCFDSTGAFTPHPLAPAN